LSSSRYCKESVWEKHLLNCKISKKKKKKKPKIELKNEEYFDENDDEKKEIKKRTLKGNGLKGVHDIMTGNNSRSPLRDSYESSHVVLNKNVGNNSSQLYLTFTHVQKMQRLTFMASKILELSSLCELIDGGMMEEILYYLPKTDDSPDNQSIVESVFDLLYHIPSMLLIKNQLETFEKFVSEFKRVKGFTRMFQATLDYQHGGAFLIAQALCSIMRDFVLTSQFHPVIQLLLQHIRSFLPGGTSIATYHDSPDGRARDLDNSFYSLTILASREENALTLIDLGVAYVAQQLTFFSKINIAVYTRALVLVGVLTQNLTSKKHVNELIKNDLFKNILHLYNSISLFVTTVLPARTTSTSISPTSVGSLLVLQLLPSHISMSADLIHNFGVLLLLHRVGQVQFHSSGFLKVLFELSEAISTTIIGLPRSIYSYSPFSPSSITSSSTSNSYKSLSSSESSLPPLFSNSSPYHKKNRPKIPTSSSTRFTADDTNARARLHLSSSVPSFPSFATPFSSSSSSPSSPLSSPPSSSSFPRSSLGIPHFASVLRKLQCEIIFCFHVCAHEMPCMPSLFLLGGVPHSISILRTCLEYVVDLKSGSSLLDDVDINLISYCVRLLFGMCFYLRNSTLSLLNSSPSLSSLQFSPPPNQLPPLPLSSPPSSSPPSYSLQNSRFDNWNTNQPTDFNQLPPLPLSSPPSSSPPSYSLQNHRFDSSNMNQPIIIHPPTDLSSRTSSSSQALSVVNKNRTTLSRHICSDAFDGCEGLSVLHRTFQFLHSVMLLGAGLLDLTHDVVLNMLDQVTITICLLFTGVKKKKKKKKNW
jgi:hypothetical protein